MSIAEDYEVAMVRLERLRSEHNGIMSVETFMGHDGHNVVRLRDYDKVLAIGESGRSLLEAASRAEFAWRMDSFWGFHGVVTIAQAATEIYGVPRDPGSADNPVHGADLPGVFSTACVQSHVFRETGWNMTGDEVAARLEGSAKIIRLRGGCHWILLPDGLERHMEPGTSESRDGR